MKKTIFVAMLVATAFTCAQAQKEGAGGTGNSSQVLMELENKWVDALVKADAATLDSIFADTYVDTDEHSQRSDKQGVIAVVKSGDLKLDSIKLSDMHVYEYGDAAVVTGTGEQAGNFKGQQVTPKIIFTDTFVRKNGKWIAVASHRSVI